MKFTNYFIQKSTTEENTYTLSHKWGLYVSVTATIKEDGTIKLSGTGSRKYKNDILEELNEYLQEEQQKEEPKEEPKENNKMTYEVKKVKRIVIKKETLEQAKIDFCYGVRCENCGKVIWADIGYEREILVENYYGKYLFHCEDCMEEAKENSDYKTYECHLSSGQIDIYKHDKIISI